MDKAEFNHYNFSMKTRTLGFSLIEVLVAVGVLSIVMTALLSTISLLSRQVMNVTNRLDVSQAEGVFNALLSDPNICTCSFSGNTFDSTNLAAVNVAVGTLYRQCGPDVSIITVGLDYMNIPYRVNTIGVNQMFSTTAVPPKNCEA